MSFFFLKWQTKNPDETFWNAAAQLKRSTLRMSSNQIASDAADDDLDELAEQPKVCTLCCLATFLNHPNYQNSLESLLCLSPSQHK